MSKIVIPLFVAYMLGAVFAVVATLMVLPAGCLK